MKRVLCSALTVLLIIMLMAPCAAAAPQKLNAFEKYIQYRDPLTHTYKCLTEDKELNVVYFGGSVTAGYGSTDGNHYSWRALSEQWLKTNFPEAKFRITNTAIGESGTFLGTYRVKDDVIDKNPDLLFIEYAINDKYKGCSKEQAALQYETIVREVRTALPNCDIVTLLVTDDSASNSLPELYPTAAGHEMIAKAYNIPTVNVGASLVESMKDKKAEWSKYFIDIVHPTDAGYRKYYECLEEFLYNSLMATDFTAQSEGHIMPPLQSKTLLDGKRQELFGREMLPYCVEAKGFYFTDELYYGPADTPHYGYYYADSTTENAEITFRFAGTELAIWTNFYKNSEIEYSVDGGEYVKMKCDSHAPTLVMSGLASGNHTITIKPIVYEASTEGRMKLAALFVRDESYETSAEGRVNGDVNKDGKTDVRDLVRLKKMVTKSGEWDINQDGSTNAEDLAVLKKVMLGEISFYPTKADSEDNSLDIEW